MTVTLDLFGALHTDRYGVVRRELAARVDETDADAVFLEYPAERQGAVAWLLALLQYPVAVAGFGIYGAFSYALYALGTRRVRPAEQRAVETVADERSLPTYHVDPSGGALFPRGEVAVAAANWLVLAGLAVVASPATVAATVLAGTALPATVRQVAGVTPRLGAALALLALPAFLWVVLAVGSAVALLVCFLGFVATTYAKLSARDEAMLERIERHCAEADHERVVFVVGTAHLDGVRERVAAGTVFDAASVWVRRPLRSGRAATVGDADASVGDDADASVGDSGSEAG